MQVNAVPHYDMSDNTTGCCPRFKPGGWDEQTLHFRDKPFVRAETRSAMHVPLNMGPVFERVQRHIMEADAFSEDDCIILSRDPSPWRGEHFFSVTKPVPDEEMVTLSGDYLTKVFEGPYREAKGWLADLDALARKKGRTPKDAFFFYTTCPKCAKAYGRNYVVGVVEVEPETAGAEAA